MLKVTKTRQLVAEFFAQDGDQQKLVKTTVVNTDNEAVSTTSETLHDPDLYAKNRSSMRKHEQELRENRLTILEKDIENLHEFKTSANKRLDNHDEQNKAILVLAEQVKSLGEDVRELKNLIQNKQ